MKKFESSPDMLFALIVLRVFYLYATLGLVNYSLVYLLEILFENRFLNYYFILSK